MRFDSVSLVDGLSNCNFGEFFEFEVFVRSARRNGMYSACEVISGDAREFGKELIVVLRFKNVKNQLLFFVFYAVEFKIQSSAVVSIGRSAIRSSSSSRMSVPNY